MNVLLTNSTDIFAGGEDYVLLLARHLRLRRHTVHVAALPDHLLLEKCAAQGIPAIPVDFRGMSRVFGVAAELRGHLRRLGIEVVHSNANYDRTAAAFACLGLQTVHVAGVHSSHSISHNITHRIRNRWLTAHFIADAPAIGELLAREDGIPAGRITVMPIGVENSPRDYDAAMRQKTRAGWRVSPETVVVGNVARLVPFKGHRVLLEAVAQVVRKRQDVLFPVIGDGELRGELQQQAAQLGIEGSLRFLGFQDNLQELYPAFDVYCHSSLEMAAEAFPIAILRALATGLPVVCTEVGGIRQMVREGMSGHLVPPDRPDLLADALLHVIGDRELRTSMGRASFQLFSEKFHASAMAENVEVVYLRAAGMGGTAPKGQVVPQA